MTHTILVVFEERKVNPLPRRRRRRFGSLGSASASVRFVGFGIGVDVSAACFVFETRVSFSLSEISFGSLGTVVTVSPSPGTT